MLLWYHGTKAQNWKNSGWVLDGVLYPVEYSNDPNGPDKILGKDLLKREVMLHPEGYHPDVVKELNVHS